MNFERVKLTTLPPSHWHVVECLTGHGRPGTAQSASAEAEKIVTPRKRERENFMIAVGTLYLVKNIEYYQGHKEDKEKLSKISE